MTFDRIVQRIVSQAQGYALWCSLWRQIKPILAEGQRLVVEIRRETRSSQQNALMWSCLTDISRQVYWPVDGRMTLLTAAEWKEVLTASLTHHTRVAQGIDGGWVILGSRTSTMTVAEMSDLIELCHSFGAVRDVEWSPTSLGDAGPAGPLMLGRKAIEPVHAAEVTD